MSIDLDLMLVRSPDVSGGRLRIDGTQITVSQIVTLHKQGCTPEDVIENCPHIKLAEVYAALGYYHANQPEIEAELAADEANYDRLDEALGYPS